MIIIPSIDLKEGKCVRLVQGNFNQASIYHETPIDTAQTFFKKGASTLHVVDLDGAKNGRLTQINSIQNIRAAFHGTIQVGGGIRTSEEIELLFKYGIDRVVLGSYALQNISQTIKWITQYGTQAIVLALDFKMMADIPYLAIQGWQQQTQQTLWDILDYYADISYVLCTDISKDGMQTGPNFQFYDEFINRYPHLSLQSSGGISTLQDILSLKKLGVSSAIVGKALYENKISLEDALQCSK